MRTHLKLKVFSSRINLTIGAALIGILVPLAAQGKQPATTCNALVSMAGDLYLASSTGNVLTRFTTGGVAADFATLSPDGEKVAYASGDSAKTFEVVNKYGQQGTFPLNASNDVNESTYTKAEGYLMGLAWASKNMLRVTRFGGKDYQLFEFRRIPEDLSPPAPLTRKILSGDCVLNHDGDQVACLTQGGGLYVRGADYRDEVFSVSLFQGIKPEESFLLGVGESINTEGTDPSYKITLKEIDKNGITLRVTLPGGSWNEMVMQNGSYDMSPPPYDSGIYGFRATLVNQKKKQVRIDVIKSTSPAKMFDPALAWQPHGRGLLFIQHTNTQTFFDLVQPGRGHVSGHPANGQGPQWHLAAQVPISLPGKVQSMRFLTPDLLLVNTGDFRGPRYSEVPIHIANRQDSGNPSLTVGTVKPLPTTIAVTTDGKTAQASVLDWSCKTSHGNGDDD